jgi:hypothetical protein
MSSLIQSAARAAVLAGGAIALSASSIAAQAAEPAATVVEGVPTPDAQIVVRDAGSGKLRHASPEEAAELKEKGAQFKRIAPAQRLVPHDHRSGARGVRLNESFMTYSVVVKQPDGQLAELCVEGRDTADAAVKSAAAIQPRNTLPTE